MTLWKITTVLVSKPAKSATCACHNSKRLDNTYIHIQQLDIYAYQSMSVTDSPQLHQNEDIHVDDK